MTAHLIVLRLGVPRLCHLLRSNARFPLPLELRSTPLSFFKSVTGNFSVGPCKCNACVYHNRKHTVDIHLESKISPRAGGGMQVLTSWESLGRRGFQMEWMLGPTCWRVAVKDRIADWELGWLRARQGSGGSGRR